MSSNSVAPKTAAASDGSSRFTFWPIQEPKNILNGTATSSVLLEPSCFPFKSVCPLSAGKDAGRTAVLTPNGAREQLQSKIPRKPSHPSRIPKPARQSHSHTFQNASEIAREDWEALLPAGEQEPDNTGSPPMSAMSEPLLRPRLNPPTKNWRQTSAGAVQSMMSRDESILPTANPVQNLVSRAASRIHRKAAIRGSSRKRGSSAIDATTGSNAPPCTPIEEPKTPLARHLRRCYGLFGGSSSPVLPQGEDLLSPESTLDSIQGLSPPKREVGVQSPPQRSASRSLIGNGLQVMSRSAPPSPSSRRVDYSKYAPVNRSGSLS